MELRQYLSIIYKRLWIVILLSLIAGSAAAYTSFFVVDKVYESNTTLYIINVKSDTHPILGQDDLVVGALLVKDYRELIKSRTVTSEVVKQLGIKNTTPEKLAERISVNAKNDTRIIEIKVQDKDPKLARDIADKIGEVFTNKAVDLMKVENINIVDNAQLPIIPIKPKPIVNIIIAVFTGILASLGIVFLMEYIDDTIKTAEDVENQLHLPVLGTIPVLELR